MKNYFIVILVVLAASIAGAATFSGWNEQTIGRSTGNVKMWNVNTFGNHSTGTQISRLNTFRCYSTAWPSGGGGCSGTYGNTTNSATIIGEGTTTWMAVKQITGACNGNLASIVTRMQYYGQTAGWRYSFVLYSDNAGSPGTLLGSVVGTATDSSTVTDVTETLTTATSATTFWVGLIAETSPYVTYTATTGGTARFLYACAAAYNAPPSTWGTGCTADNDYNAYNLEIAVNY